MTPPGLAVPPPLRPGRAVPALPPPVPGRAVPALPPPPGLAGPGEVATVPIAGAAAAAWAGVVAAVVIAAARVHSSDPVTIFFTSV